MLIKINFLKNTWNAIFSYYYLFSFQFTIKNGRNMHRNVSIKIFLFKSLSY